MQRYNVSGTVYDDTGAPAIGRKVIIYQRSTGNKITEIITGGDGTFGAWMVSDDPVYVVALPSSGDGSNARVFDNVIPKPFISEANVNSIGTPGTMGFGVGICPNPPFGMSPLDGYNNPLHENYGNYQYSDGSIMVWIPAFYYKWGDGSNGFAMNELSLVSKVDFADEATANAAGYVINRAFIDGGVIKDGFFIDKYQNSRNPQLNCPSSVQNMRILTITTKYGYTSKFWNGYELADFGAGVTASSAVDIAKYRGSNFSVISTFMATAIWMLFVAQRQSAPVDSNVCAWKQSYNVNYYIPRGRAGDNYFDTLDRGANFICLNEYATYGLIAGGCSQWFESTTHNGQRCGITDITGGNHDITIGVIQLGSGGHTLKESVSLKTISSSNILNTSLLDYLDTYLYPGGVSSGTWYYRNESVQTFSNTLVRSSTDYRRCSFGMPNSSTKLRPATGNTDIFGGAIYPYATPNYLPAWGGFTSAPHTTTNGSFAGPGAWGYDNPHVTGTASNVSFRLGLYL